MDPIVMYDALCVDEISQLREENLALRQELEDLRVEFRALQDEVGLYHFLCRPALEIWLEQHPGPQAWPRLHEVLEWAIALISEDQQNRVLDASAGTPTSADPAEV